MNAAMNSLIHRTGTVVLATFACMVALLVCAPVPAAHAADTISFRAAAEIAANQQTHRVTIPASVRETDGLLLFVTSNRQLATITETPAGWTLIGTQNSSNDVNTTLYAKSAAADDAGRSQAVAFSATTKATLTLLAYDG